jgi:hypothetical protein
MRRSIEVDFTSETQPPAGSISWSNITDVPSNVVVFADVAFTGSYNDLIDTPPPGEGGGASTWGELGGDQSIVSLSGFTNDLGQELPGTIAWNNVFNKPDFFSGSYLDLTNTPPLFSGSYNDLLDTPTFANVAVSGSYNDLVDTPSLFSGSYGDLTGVPNFASVAVSGSYNDLTNTPSLFSGSYGDLTGVPNFASVAVSGSYNDLINTPALFSGSYLDLTDKPTLFSGSYNDLADVPTFANVAFSGSYNDLTDKPSTSGGSNVGGIPQATAIAEAMAQSPMNVALSFTPSDDGGDVTWTLLLSNHNPDSKFVFNLPAGYEIYSEFIESVHVKFMCRDANGNEFMSGSNSTTMSFDPTGLVLTVTENGYTSVDVTNPSLGLPNLTARLTAVVRIQNFDFIIGSGVATFDPSESSVVAVNLGAGPDPPAPTPTLWEFYVLEKEQGFALGTQPGPVLYHISNDSFTITPDNFTFHADPTSYTDTSVNTVEELVTNGNNTTTLVIIASQDSYAGALLWSILDPSGKTWANFNILWSSSFGRKPGLEIRRNGTPVHRQPRGNVETTFYPISSDDDGSEFTYDLSMVREWVFFEASDGYFYADDDVLFRGLISHTFPLTPENLKMDSNFLLSGPVDDPFVALTDGSYSTAVRYKPASNFGRRFTIYDTTGNDAPSFTISKEYFGGFRIYRNGVNVSLITDPADQYSSTTVTYTVPPPNLWEFYVFEKERGDAVGTEPGPVLYHISNPTFPITPSKFTFHVDPEPYTDTSMNTVEELVTDGGNTTTPINIASRDSYAGAKLWSILDLSGDTSANFNILWGSGRKPGIEIRRNGTPVFRSGRGNAADSFYTISSDDDGSEFTYDLSMVREWIFYESHDGKPVDWDITDERHVYEIDCNEYAITPDNLKLDHDVGNPSVDILNLTDGNVVISSSAVFLDTYDGARLWTIYDTTGNDTPSFVVTWHNKLRTPGITIRRNGVEALSVPYNTDVTPEGNLTLTYTIP